MPERILYKTIGMNPLTTSDELLSSALMDVSIKTQGEIDKIFFFGAGCGTAESRMHILNMLCQFFPESEVEVDTDLMGASKALCGQEEGMVGILGTGSNACLYDGKRITKKIPSLGFLLGDEGSGNHLGRLILKEYITQRMPSSLEESFRAMFPFSYDEFIQKIYKESQPNRFLASLTPFALKHREDPFMASILRNSFKAFIEQMVLPLGGEDLYLTGSVAELFKEEISFCCDSYGIQLMRVMKDPMVGLMELEKWI